MGRENEFLFLVLLVVLRVSGERIYTLRQKFACFHPTRQGFLFALYSDNVSRLIRYAVRSESPSQGKSDKLAGNF